MKAVLSYRLLFTVVLLFAFGAVGFAQSKVQKPDKTQRGDGKKNQRPPEKTEEQRKQEEEQRRLEEEARTAERDDDPVTVKTNIVSVDAVVYDKKSGNIITGLKRENFAIFENGVKQEIAQFATPEAPITVTLLVEYSRWSEVFGAYASRGFEPGKFEVVRPVAFFLQKFIKPPDDYASVIAFDLRPTPITDFTNDPNRLRATVDLLLRNNPAFRENNLFDSIRFALVGGKGDAVVLENSKEEYAQYGGMVDVKAKRRAIILVASGINTFSKTSYDDARKVVQQSGIPFYIISTGNLFFKMYEQYLPATDGLNGMPGRLTFLQAQNTMNTFAKESGGAHYPVTFESEVPNALNSINAMMRNQYSLAYDAGEKPRDGKKYKLEVKVDLNGDGIYEEKTLVIQHRPFFQTEKDKKK
jgi:Ca-activated chloride channel family protein